MHLHKKSLVILLLLSYTSISDLYSQPSQGNIERQHDLETIIITSKAIDENFFINLLINDQSLYEGFINMKYFSFIAENDIVTFSKDKISAHVYKKIAHCNYNGNYKQTIIDSLDSGKVYKNNGKYRLFTLQMFSYLFENINSTDFTNSVASNKKNIFNKELYKEKLKTLVFNPGKKVTELPFITSKSEIFSAKLKHFYQSKISTIYYNQQEAYRFEYYVRPEYANNNSLVIQRVDTIIDKQNSKILSRFIYLKHDNILFNFDVKMDIQTINIDGTYLPSEIKYDGSWHVLFKKTEKARFSIKHYNYIKNNSSECPVFCKTDR